MKIIDIHTHIGDLLFGRPLVPYESYEPYTEIPSWTTAYEQSEFDISKMQAVITPELLKYYEGMLALGERGMRILEAVQNQERNNAATVDNLLRAMKKNGVDYSVVLPIEPYRLTEENIKVCKKHKNILTFASVHPKDPEKMEKLRRYMKLGCRGLKIHPVIQGIHPSDPSVLELMEEYQKYNLPVLFHTGESTYYVTQSEERRAYARLQNYEEVISSFPRINFILGHMGQMERETALEMGEKFKNVCMDTTLQPVEGVQDAIKRLGADRVLYASDYPFSVQDVHIRIINKVAEDDAQLKEKLFHKNAERLIGKVG